MDISEFLIRVIAEAAWECDAWHRRDPVAYRDLLTAADSIAAEMQAGSQ